jgi:hypothetical protein
VEGYHTWQWPNMAGNKFANQKKKKNMNQIEEPNKKKKKIKKRASK